MFDHNEPARNVVEVYLGRPLNPGEVIHHLNGNHNDNRIENLMVFEDQAAHTAFHRLRGMKKIRCINQHRRKGIKLIDRWERDYRNILSAIIFDGRKHKKHRLARLNYFKEKTKQELCVI